MSPGRKKAEPVHLRSYRSAKFFSFCSDGIYPHNLSGCSPRKKLWLPLCNIDLKKSLSPQVWPNTDRAYFSVSTLDASLLVLKFPKYPFLNFSSGRYLILHLGRITRKGGQSPVLTLRHQGNHFHLPHQLHPQSAWDLLEPWGPMKLAEAGQYPVFCSGFLRKARAAASTGTLLLES